MKVALDTNVLAYAEGVNGASMKKVALELLQKLPDGSAALPVQVLGELFSLLVRKAGRSPGKARKAILSWQDAFPLIETSAEVMVAAVDLATDHKLNIWDSIILSAAAEAGFPSSFVRRLTRRLHLAGSYRDKSLWILEA